MKQGLTNNQLKIIAMITMTLDHIGLFMPQYPVLRILGRLAFPIFAYMIAEGCAHTRNIWRYLGSVALMAALCQVVQYVTTGSVYMGILVTFSLSILLIALIKDGYKFSVWIALIGVFLISTVPILGTDFQVDYGFVGVLTPVAVYLMKNKWGKAAACAVMLCALGLSYGTTQWYALLAVPLLLAYNGQRGKLKLKNLFYWYYPAHIAVIYAIFSFLQ